MSRRDSMYGTPSKRPKLDISVTNADISSKSSNIANPPSTFRDFANDDDPWGDDGDDILLLASQACEQAETTGASLPIVEFSKISNTQISVIDAPQSASLTKSLDNAFKRPIDCNTSSSRNPADQSMQHMMSQLRTFKIDLDKTKYENELLTDKCLTKEGEVSMLRIQLKGAQSQLDKVKMDRLKVHEKSQMEHNVKIQSLNKEIQGYQAQLDFKNLELVNVKDKCRLLESSKIRLIEPVPPTLDNNRWPSFSQKMNTSTQKAEQSFRAPVSNKDSPVQTECSENFKLHPMKDTCYPLLDLIDECIYQSRTSVDILLTFKSNKETSVRKNVFCTFSPKDEKPKCSDSDVRLDAIYEHTARLTKMTQKELECKENAVESISKICIVAAELCLKSLSHLRDLMYKMTPSSIREMDEKYLEVSGLPCQTLENNSLFHPSSWCENEQAVDARRCLAVLAAVCRCCKFAHQLLLDPLSPALGPLYQEYFSKEGTNLWAIFVEICQVIGTVGCSHHYPGLLASISAILKNCIQDEGTGAISYKNILSLLKELVFLRPGARVLQDVCNVMWRECRRKDFLDGLCTDLIDSNISLDYHQGVMLYSSSSCFLQVLCCQVKVSWSHPSYDNMRSVFSVTRSLLDLLYSGSHHDMHWAVFNPNCKCHCYVRMYQCLVVCLQRCSSLYMEHRTYICDEDLRRHFNSVLRSGISSLHTSTWRDPDLVARLEVHEASYHMFLSEVDDLQDQLQLLEMHREALAELTTAMSANFENVNTPCDEAKHIWKQSCQNFWVTD